MRRKTDYERGLSPEQAADKIVNKRKKVTWGKGKPQIMTDLERELVEEKKPPQLLKLGSSYHEVSADEQKEAQKRAEEEQRQREIDQERIDMHQFVTDYAAFFKAIQMVETGHPCNEDAITLFKMFRAESRGM